MHRGSFPNPVASEMAKTKERNGNNKGPKLCYHAKFHGKLPFVMGKLRFEPKHQCARLKLVTVKLGEASLSKLPL